MWSIAIILWNAVTKAFSAASSESLKEEREAAGTHEIHRMAQEVLLQDLFAETLFHFIASHTNNIWADPCIVLPAKWD